VRRLSAEELFDAISQATQVFPEIAIGGTDKKVKYVLQAHSSEDLRDSEMKRFLDFFGQSNRDKDERDLTGSIVQTSLMLNSSVVKQKVLRSTEGSRVQKLLVQKPAPDAKQLTEALYLATLARFPSPEEAETCIAMLQADPEHGPEDLQWALLNKLDFIFNY
jgi:hypothetical protein